MRKTRTDLLQLQAKIEGIEKELKQLGEGQRERLHQLEIQKERLQVNAKTSTENAKKYELTVAELNAVLKLYGYQFELEKAAALFTTLQELHQKHAHQSTIKQELVSTLEKLSIQQEQFKERSKEKEVAVKSLEEEIQALRQEVDGIHKERAAVLGEQDPLQLQNQLEEQLRLQQETVNTIAQQVTALRTEEKSLHKRLEAQQANLGSKLTEAAQEEDALIERIMTSGFENLNTLAAALLTPDDFQQKLESGEFG
jgi:chromosome segregation ATPase